MRGIRAALTVVTIAIAGVAHGADSTVKISGLKGSYGSAGCGLGSLLIGSERGGVQILAATTNGFFFNQTFAITSGTWNCGEAAIGRAGAKTFIEANREALAKDAARGGGETIDTLTALAGCKDAKAVGVVLQRRFPELFPGERTPAEAVSEAVLGTLGAEPALACRAIG